MSDGDVSRVPMEQLLQELPLEDSNLVPLNVLVERLSNLAYQNIQNLGDTLPSLSSHAKRAKIFSTAIELRKIFVKLLVIVRWSKDVEMLNRARNVIGLLVEQQWAHEDVFSGLTQVRKILPNARIFDADLVTAIDVLRTGTYMRLPKAIKDSTVPQDPMSDSEALDVMSQLDLVLRERLACSELAPLGLYLTKIESGKAYFEAARLYNICLTTSGPAEDDRWWLLEFSFVDQVSASDNLNEILTEP
ncbi:mediator complex subunit [Malassezia nana]|uniref:Mediator of RNA polymerase II transcription subunit 14 n=1 Tax=Malassezia nana TaxID=180528 RepID=A0AAF0EL61_9BASI|nr:mediator complex subunit [Malassezia nana]